MSITLAAISGIVSAAVKYLLMSKGLETAARKATERVGEMGGEALVNAGKNALAKLRDALTQRGDAAKKAQKALADVEDDPTDEDYQRKFATELDKLAANDERMRALLEQLSTEIEHARGTERTHNQHIGNNAHVGAAIAGDVHGGINVGSIDAGDQIDAQNAQGTINRPSGAVHQQFGDQRQGAFVNGGTVYGTVIGTNSGTVSQSYGEQHTHPTRDAPPDDEAHSRGLAENSPSTRSMPPNPTPTRSAPFAPAPAPSVPVPLAPAAAPPAPPPSAPAPTGAVPIPAPKPRHLVGRFPERVQLGTRVPLQVRVALQPATMHSVALREVAIPPQGAEIKLVIYCPGFKLLSPSMITVLTPGDADSDWALFELEAERQGVHMIEITAFLGGAFLGTLAMEATADPALETGPSIQRTSDMTLRRPEAGEVTLEIRYDRANKLYRYQLRSKTIGETDEILSASLLGEPEQVVNQFASLMNAQARNLTKYTDSEARRWLKGMGTYLWDGLIPKELNDLFWEHRDSMSRMTILSAGDPIPWEMMYPFGKDRAQDHGFLAEQFTVTRWLFGAPPANQLHHDRSYFVLPDDAPPTAQQEIAQLQQALGGTVVDQLTPLLDLIDSAQFNVLHFAVHNVHQPDHLTASYVPLGQKHFDQAFLGPAYRGRFRDRAPLVFMNACRSDGMAPNYTQMTSWARSFVSAGAGAFVGSLWEVRDATATHFAHQFYTSLLGGATVGSALTDARTAIQHESGDPTWLAYTLYGDPTATFAQEAAHV